MSLSNEMLIEGLGYKGNNFWENYILSNTIRNFSSYIKEYGSDGAIELFSEVFGEGTKPLFEIMISDKENLFEAAKVSGILLFENAGEQNIENYLFEVETGFIQTAGGAFNPMNINRQRIAADAAMTIKTKALGIGSFLGRLWTKIKDLGKEAFSKILPYLKSGFTWAKEIARKGITWIASSPIARVAIPAVLIGGGILAAKKLINKTRKKTKKKEMTPEEEDALESIVEKNKAKIEEYARKVKEKK